MSTSSRYDGVPTATLLMDDGQGGLRPVAYLLPRGPAAPGDGPALAWHRVRPDDRLDLLGARYLGDPAAAWRIADANLALDPDDVLRPGAGTHVVRIPVPGA